MRDSQTRFHFLMATAAEANTATNPKSGQGNDYKEMYSKSRPKALPSGVEAPDFTLRSTPDQWLALSEFRGQPVVLAFYPADWSPVCGDQMALYNEMLKEFHELGAELIGISVDGAWCHAAFARDRKLHFPLLADLNRRVMWRAGTACTATRMVSANARCLLSMRREKFTGALFHRSE